MREDAMYLKETRAPSGYEKSDQVLFVEAIIPQEKKVGKHLLSQLLIDQM